MPWVSFHIVISFVSSLCLQELRYSALHDAARMGRLAIAKRLLEGGADPTLRAHAGKTALELARENGKSEVVALLSEPRYANGDRTECESNAELNANRMRNRLRTE
jgi:ankyrin repeat protein